jgi:homoserine/homoserine lactone efflux protein
MPQLANPSRPTQAAPMTSLSILTTHGLLLFIGAELIFSLTPGPAVMMISAYGIKGGFRDALAAIAGTQTGNTLWYVICVTGLGALVTASPTLFHAIRLAGAAYLVFLGAGAIWKSFHAAPGQHGPRLMGAPYIQTTLTQMGNPKAILFFGAIVPQFLDTRGALIPQYLIMYVITFIGESIILTGYGWLASHGARLAGLNHAVWRERISGLVLLGLGVAAAVA